MLVQRVSCFLAGTVFIHACVDFRGGRGIRLSARSERLHKLQVTTMEGNNLKSCNGMKTTRHPYYHKRCIPSPPPRQIDEVRHLHLPSRENSGVIEGGDGIIPLRAFGKRIGLALTHLSSCVIIGLLEIVLSGLMRRAA